MTHFYRKFHSVCNVYQSSHFDYSIPINLFAHLFAYIHLWRIIREINYTNAVSVALFESSFLVRELLIFEMGFLLALLILALYTVLETHLIHWM